MNHAQSKTVKVRQCHTLTLSALLARGAVYFVPRKGFVQVELTVSGNNLLRWARTAKLVDYRTTALPDVQKIKEKTV